MSHPKKLSIFWHRRDLRIEDNAGLTKALKGEHPILPIFIFDQNILDHLPAKDARVQFIHRELSKLKCQYETAGSTLMVFYGRPEEVWEAIIEKHQPNVVYTNRDYEPYAKKRDEAVFKLFKKSNIAFIGTKDHVIFEKDDVVKDDGKPYTVFTPYMKKWKSLLKSKDLVAHPSHDLLTHLAQRKPEDILSLESMGFESFDFEYPDSEIDISILESYADRRDIPSLSGTSRLSLHLRFGTVSIRALARTAQKHSEKWLNELIWRDFYQCILYHFPLSAHQAFKPQYDHIPWRHSDADFEKWCKGETGYPIVDAGMRELNETGFMHNRVRMIVASFLTKHLLIDWRLGERYFAEKLLDFELASNVGGWQWAAGSGCDAAPYFRVFNPTAQQEKFDRDFKYIKKWVPEFGTDRYPEPMVEHKMARNRAIDTYKAALS